MSNYESQRENTTNNEQPPVRKKRKKRRSGCLPFLIYILFVAGVSFALSALVITVANDVFGLVQDDVPVMMSLEEGADVNEVSVKLKENKLIDHKWAFKLYCQLKYVETFSTGEFELASNMDYGQLISELRRANQKTETVTLTIPEGYNIQQIAELLESSRVCGKKELIETANTYDFSHGFLEDVPMVENRLEGYLFPDTYEFYINERPVSALNKMLNNFNKKYTDEMRKLTEEHGTTIAEVVNIASLIEKEARLAREQGTISGVIHNRLNKADAYPFLDIDAALLYVTGHKEQLTAEDLQMDSPYNLRKSKGLPPTAICNPGIGALLAAISPESHNYHYYVVNKTADNGSHIFSSTLDEHNAAIARMQ